MPVHFDTAKKRWRFRYRRRIDGKRYQLTKLLPAGWSRAQAEAYDRKECGRLFAENAGVTTPRLPLAGAVQLYLDHRCPELKNGRKAAQDLAHLLPKIEAAYVDQLAEVASEYIKENRKLSAGTLHNRLAYLRSAVNYARKAHGYGKGLPDYTIDMNVPVPSNERQVYAVLPELRRIWGKLEPEARACFEMAFYMGLRWRAELLPRKPSDVKRNGRDVWLKVGETKNGREVMKPVHPAVRHHLKRLPFKHGDGWFYKRWRKAAKAIGRPDLKPHDAARHSLASEVLSRPDGSLDKVRAALHHTSLQSAQRYAHLYPSSMKAIIWGIGSNIGHRKRRKPKRAASA